MVEGPPKPTTARFALAENLKALMRLHGIENPRQMAGKVPGVSYKTIERMLKPYATGGPNLDSIDAVAHYFKITTPQLLTKQPLLEGNEPRIQESPTAKQDGMKKGTKG